MQHLDSALVKTRKFVQEAARLAPKSADGTYPVVIITEGEGSSGSYSAELLEHSESVFANTPSFLNHPIDPSKPHLRDVNTIAGRLGDVRVGEDGGKRALLSAFKPRDEKVAQFIDDFGDIIGLSIYCQAEGEEMDDGRIRVTEFDASDPYRSVDIVVAAGRGGKFQRAEESLRAIESSLGIPVDKPASTSAPESNKEESMDEVLKAIEALTAKFDTFLSEQKDAADKAAQAEADAQAKDKDVSEAVEAAVGAVEAVKAAKVLPSFESKLIEKAKKGGDITEDLAFAVEVTKEAAAPKKEAAADGATFIYESAGDKADDFILNIGGK